MLHTYNIQQCIVGVCLLNYVCMLDIGFLAPVLSVMQSKFVHTLSNNFVCIYLQTYIVNVIRFLKPKPLHVFSYTYYGLSHTMKCDCIVWQVHIKSLYMNVERKYLTLLSLWLFFGVLICYCERYEAKWSDLKVESFIPQASTGCQTTRYLGK